MALSPAGFNVNPAIKTQKCNAWTTARFAPLNKQDWLSDYESQVAAGEYRTESVNVVEVVNLTADQYDDFIFGLLTDREWLAGKGGNNSHYETPAGVESFWQLTEDQQEAWRAESYTICVAVQCDGKRTLYIDPQGHKYARYVGI